MNENFIVQMANGQSEHFVVQMLAVGPELRPLIFFACRCGDVVAGVGGAVTERWDRHLKDFRD